MLRTRQHFRSRFFTSHSLLVLFVTVGLLRSDHTVYILYDGVGYVFAEGWFMCSPYRDKDLIFEILCLPLKVTCCDVGHLANISF